MQFPVLLSQMRTKPSSEAEARNLPSELQATSLSPCPCEEGSAAKSGSKVGSALVASAEGGCVDDDEEFSPMMRSHFASQIRDGPSEEAVVDEGVEKWRLQMRISPSADELASRIGVKDRS